jgi:hypothetical protein
MRDKAQKKNVKSLGRKELVRYKEPRKAKLCEMRDRSFRDGRDQKNLNFKAAVRCASLSATPEEVVAKQFQFHLHLN